ncbi:TubC N-terminal docking domain-related protein [Burkholderia vietnamiensis]|uniref:TubC N-terminal docking domain-related protein n=1 Tax=Burkholderia vietnamiensis TaxID=60552 RepID=UPI000A5DC3D3|nr:hypothetical protein [Burkholderia vietnamiensis]MCA7983420.1 hypothetical protein [Burkholderia vietnamiensis]
MNADEIVSKAKALRVRLWVEDDRVKIAGPSAAVAALKPEIIAHKAAVIAHLLSIENHAVSSDGALLHPDGGAYLPWGPRLSADDVQQLRAELAGLIEALSAREHWRREHLDSVLGRAMRGPLSDLMPNLHYFRERLAELDAERAAGALAGRLIQPTKGGRTNGKGRNDV